jgi:zinc-ribbon domain
MNARRWRRMTWVVVAWSGLILGLTLVQMLQTASKSCSEFSLDSDCVRIEVNGRAAAVVEWLLRGIVVWIIGFAVLAVIWFMTRQQARTCPHCGENVERGLTACANCGYDFTLGRNPAAAAAASTPRAAAPASASVAAAPAPVASMPREGWYDDAERPGRKRWWNGTAWGMRDDEHPSRATVAPPADADGSAEGPQLDAEPASEIGIAAAPARSPSAAAPEPVAVATAVKPASEAVPTATTSSRPELTGDGRQTAGFCENCGAERRPGARFCASCGHAH